MEVGCDVTFYKHRCTVRYNGKIILSGDKDPSTDLWTLPLGSMDMTAHRIHDAIPSAASFDADAHAHLPTPIACFTHAVRNKVISILFTHQSLCNPRISTLLKAIRRGYLKGCPNLTAKGVAKYPNPSPATTKDHMKQLHQSICSTQPKPANPMPSPQLEHPILPLFQEPQAYPGSAYDPMHGCASSNSLTHCMANIIEDNDSPYKAKLFCFATFSDKHTGTLYNNLTGLLPFQSLEGNVCFLVVYHYKTNVILALPISNFSDKIIFAAYKQQYEMLESKGRIIRLNVMGNQAGQTINKFLTKKQCKLMWVEPRNHCVNAAERAIQTFKYHFVSTLATTDSEFPLQLWDRLALQVKNILNMLYSLQIDPNLFAYEAVHGPYNWNRFPLAPLGCKLVVCESPEARTLWGSRGTDAWYVGLSLIYYRCKHYFFLET
jgi:hypothetical protein